MLDFDLEKPPAEIVALGDVGGVTSPPPHWLERGLPSRQSSLIVDPPDGKMPPMTPEGKARQTTAGGTYVKQTGFKSADELGPYDRCISRGVVGSMMPVVYNNGNEIIQAPGLVAFRNEMIHETRDHPARRTRVAADEHEVVDGHVARTLRGQHARRRDEEPEWQDRHAGQRDDADPERRDRDHRALHAAQRQHPAVRGDDQRPEDLDQAVEGRRSRCAATATTRCSSTPATRATTRCAIRCRARAPTRSGELGQRSEARAWSARPD